MSIINGMDSVIDYIKAQDQKIMQLEKEILLGFNEINEEDVEEMKKEIEDQRVEIINLEEEVCSRMNKEQEKEKDQKIMELEKRWSNEDLQELFANEGLLEDDGDDFDIEEIVTNLEIKEEHVEQDVMDFFDKEKDEKRWSNEDLKILFSKASLREDDDDFDIEKIVKTMEITEWRNEEIKELSANNEKYMNVIIKREEEKDELIENMVKKTELNLKLNEENEKLTEELDLSNMNEKINKCIKVQELKEEIKELKDCLHNPKISFFTQFNSRKDTKLQICNYYEKLMIKVERQEEIIEKLKEEIKKLKNIENDDISTIKELMEEIEEKEEATIKVDNSLGDGQFKNLKVRNSAGQWRDIRIWEVNK